MTSLPTMQTTACMSYEVFEAMTEEELIDRFMEECRDGIWEYLIEKIEIKEV